MEADCPWRLFIALELPAVLLRYLEGEQARLRRALPGTPVRWVQAEGIHLTLRFLGPVPAAQRPALEGALRATAAGHGPLELRPAEMGWFGGRRRLRVIWIGLQGATSGLSRLRDDLDRNLAAGGRPGEGKKFIPHLTLGRVRENATGRERAALQATLERFRPTPPPAVLLEELLLVRSHLEPGGARYQVVARAGLQAPGGG